MVVGVESGACEASHSLVLFACLQISNSLAHVLDAAVCTLVDVERDVRDYVATRDACKHLYLIFLVVSIQQEDCSFFLAVLCNNYPSLSKLNMRSAAGGIRFV